MCGTKEKQRILEDMPFRDALFRCGELQISFEDTSRLLQDHNPTLLADLNNPASLAYSIYKDGEAEGRLKLNIDLESNVGDPDAKEGYKQLSEERRRQIINKAIFDRFGL